MPSLHLLPSQGGKLPGIMLMLPFSVHGTHEGAYSSIACAQVSPIINIHSPPIAHQICIFSYPIQHKFLSPFLLPQNVFSGFWPDALLPSPSDSLATLQGATLYGKYSSPFQINIVYMLHI